MTDEHTDDRPPAFVLTGSFPVICRNNLYLSELSRRGLAVLVLTAASYREAATAAVADRSNPASAIAGLGFVSGDVSVENSFLAGTIAQATDWRRRYRIVGVYAVGEYFAEPTGLLADALGLPGPGLRASRACRSKYLQRWYLPDLGPPSRVLPADARASADPAAVGFPADWFPVVAKPASRHSSSGVRAVRDAGELRRQLAEYPPHEVVLVERRVDGPEYSVESLVQHGRVLFASVTAKRTTESHASTFVELAHQVPARPGGPREALLAANREVLSGLAFSDGITHAEFRVGADGAPVLMEVAARTPGDGILVLYQLATGLPMEPEILRIALGEPASYPRPHRFARQVYLEHEPGVLADVSLRWPGVAPEWVAEAGGMWPEIKPGPPDDPPTLRALLVLARRGAELVPLSDSDDRAVTFFIDAATPDDLDELERRVTAAITVHTRPS